MKEAKLLTINRVAEAISAHGISMSTRTIERMVKRSQFPSPVEIGGRRMWTDAVVQRWLASKLEAA